MPERCLHWLRTTLKYVPGPGARTLELGCGHGGFVAMQRWAGLDATGLELSPWLVSRARDWFGIPVLQGRLEDQDLSAGSFDAVALMDVLEHLPDPRQTIGRAVSLLRSPGGFLLIQTPCYPAGVSYESLCAQDHPFLVQLKPMEHLYLFSEKALARLCTELGVGEVRFEPAIFAHYDQYAVASAAPLRERPAAERAPMLMAASPPARWTLALFDLAETRDATDSARSLALARMDELREQFTRMEADNAARLEVITRQGQEIGELHAEVHRRLQEAAEFAPKLDAAANEHNLLVAQIEDLRGQFWRGEEDRAARLKVIDTQGSELGEIRAQLSNTGSELTALRVHYEHSETDRAARLAVIHDQGAAISQLHSQIRTQEAAQTQLATELEEKRAALVAAGTEYGKLAADLRGAREAHSALQARYAVNDRAREQFAAELNELHVTHTAQTGEFAAARRRQEILETHWAARLLRWIGLWPR